MRDFHSFRVTWVTLALTAGVPIELVRKVTGHRTVKVVLEHYFQHGREDFRAALQTAMPDFLMDGARTPNKELRVIIHGMAETMQADKEQALVLFWLAPEN